MLKNRCENIGLFRTWNLGFMQTLNGTLSLSDLSIMG